MKSGSYRLALISLWLWWAGIGMLTGAASIEDGSGASSAGFQRILNETLTHAVRKLSFRNRKLPIRSQSQ